MAASPLLYIGRRRWIKKQPTERCPRDRATGTAALIIAIRLNDDNGAIQVHFLSSPLRDDRLRARGGCFFISTGTHKIPALLGKLLHLTGDLLRKDPNYKKRCSNGRRIVSTRDRLLFPRVCCKKVTCGARERLGKFGRAKHGAFDCKNWGQFVKIKHH